MTAVSLEGRACSMGMKRYNFLKIISAISGSMCLLASSLPVEADVLEKIQIPLSYLQKNDIYTHSEVKKSLLSLNKWISKRDKKGIKKTIDNLKTIRLNWGSRNLPFIADFLRGKGQFLFQLEEYDLGIFLLEQAKDAFPKDYRIRFSLTKIYCSNQGFDLRKGYLNLKDGLGLYLNSKLRQDRFVYSSIILFCFAFVISIYLYFMLLLLKNYKKVSYDLKKILGLNVKSLFSSFFTILLILLPGIAGGFYVFILSIPAFIWPYLRNLNKAILAVFTAFLLFCPITLGYAVEGIIKYNSSYNGKLDDFSHNVWDTETLNYFKDRLNKDMHDPFINTSVGLLYKWMGDLNKYHRIFNKLNQDNPDHVPTLINFGNSMLLSGKLDEAMKLYQQALKIAPNSVEAHYNLSLALEENMKFVEARGEYQKAHAIDPIRLQRLLSQFLAQKSNNVQPMDKIPDIPKFEATENSQILSNQMKEEVLNFLLIPLLRKESIIPFATSLLFLILLMLWRYKILTKASEQCDTCGTVFEREMKCPLCIAMKTSHMRLDPEKREMASVKIWRYSIFKKTVPTLFNAILPGSGLLFDDSDLAGFVFIFLTLFLVICGALFLICPSQPFQVEVIITFLAGYYMIINFLFIFQTKIWHLKEI